MLSQRSINNLKSSDPRFAELIKKVHEKFPCEVIEGHRNEKRQNELFEQGFTKLKWPNGKHNQMPSKAIDVMPLPIDWKNRERLILFAGYVLGVAASMGIKLRWGGDWNRNFEIKDEKFQDLPHFELDE